jgi:hypothetical protein
MNIGEIIAQLIAANGYSKTRFAKDMNMSKSFLLRIISGEKKPPETFITDILSSGVLSEESKKPLRDAYFESVFGKDTVEMMQLFLRKLDSLEDACAKKEDIYVRDHILDKALYGNTYTYPIGNADEFYEIVSYFCKKLSAEDAPFCFTNYTFTQEKLDSILYSAFSSPAQKQSVDFKHLVQVEHNLSNYEIILLFESIKWGTSYYNTYCCVAEQNYTDVLFPYYMITNNCVITFNEACTQGLVFADQSAISYYKKNFAELLPKYKPVLQFFKDEMDVLNVNQLSQSMPMYALDGTFCCGVIMDKAGWKEIAQDWLEQVDYLINLLLEHYSLDYFYDDFTLFYTKNSVSCFADTGRIMQISDKYLKPCSPALRARLIEHLKEVHINPAKLSFQLLDENKLRVPRNLDINILENMTNFIYAFDNFDVPMEQRKYFGFCITLENARYSRLFQDLREYMLKNNYCYSSTYAMHFLSNEIIKLQAQ